MADNRRTGSYRDRQTDRELERQTDRGTVGGVPLRSRKRTGTWVSIPGTGTLEHKRVRGQGSGVRGQGDC